MTYRELVGKQVTVVFGNGVEALQGVLAHNGDEQLTIVVGRRDGRQQKVLVNKATVLYVREEAS